MPLVRKRKKQHSLAHLYYTSSPTLDTVAALRLRYRRSGKVNSWKIVTRRKKIVKRNKTVFLFIFTHAVNFTCIANFTSPRQLHLPTANFTHAVNFTNSRSGFI